MSQVAIIGEAYVDESHAFYYGWLSEVQSGRIKQGHAPMKLLFYYPKSLLIDIASEIT